MADADADTDAKPLDQRALVADIDRTRAELARTIDAISDRVSPKKNVDRAMEQVRQRTAQVDPLMAGAAAAAIILGVTALFLWRRSKRLCARCRLVDQLGPAGRERPARHQAQRPPRDQPALLVSSSYSAADSRSGGSAASPLPSWATRTRNIQPAV